ncbi:acetylxylan esterase [Kitasatospora sp. NPDC048365]|uniref:acetylxylan esterase n=1 Tax=Kitasatospora sp. NPDC048365 TaxID=3364050 RepID=UPI003720B0DA
MPLTDLPLAECLEFRPELTAPEDLDAFWTRTLAEAESQAGEPVLARVGNGLELVTTYDITVTGYAGQPVRGWLRLPAGAREPLGCVVEYLGYGRGRGLAHEDLTYASAGYAHLLMDTRGQGWSAAPGDTPDPGAHDPGAVPGFVTRGIASPETHYYRRVFTDAVRFARTARSLPMVDPERVVVTGISQGGGIALATAALVPGLAGAMPDVPFLSNFRRGAEIAAQPPYTEIAEYLRLHRDRSADVFRTLSYFDAAVLARRASAPALFSIAMMDPICPPSTCFSAYHAYGGPKEVEVYEYNGHEGGQQVHLARKLAWLRRRIG